MFLSSSSYQSSSSSSSTFPQFSFHYLFTTIFFPLFSLHWKEEKRSKKKVEQRSQANWSLIWFQFSPFSWDSQFSINCLYLFLIFIHNFNIPPNGNLITIKLNNKISLNIQTERTISRSVAIRLAIIRQQSIVSQKQER